MHALSGWSDLSGYPHESETDRVEGRDYCGQSPKRAGIEDWLRTPTQREPRTVKDVLNQLSDRDQHHEAEDQP
jgi:hypothetical protein